MARECRDPGEGELLTTNRPDLLEPRLRLGRAGSTSRSSPLPAAGCRLRLFELYGRGLEPQCRNLDHFVVRRRGVSAAFIRELLRKAARRRPSRTGPSSSRSATSTTPCRSCSSRAASSRDRSSRPLAQAHSRPMDTLDDAELRAFLPRERAPRRSPSFAVTARRSSPPCVPARRGRVDHVRDGPRVGEGPALATRSTGVDLRRGRRAPVWVRSDRRHRRALPRSRQSCASGRPGSPLVTWVERAGSLVAGCRSERDRPRAAPAGRRASRSTD